MTLDKWMAERRLRIAYQAVKPTRRRYPDREHYIAARHEWMLLEPGPMPPFPARRILLNLGVILFLLLSLSVIAYLAGGMIWTVLST